MADPRIKYDIAANVSGDADVDKLASEIERLGRSLEGELKTKAESAAASLRELGARNQAAQSFFDLKQRTQDAAKALAEAQAAAQAMGKELATTTAPTRTQTAQLERLKDAVKAANTEYQASHTALGAARTALGQYGLSVDGLAKTQQVLKRELAQARTEAAAFGTQLQQQVAAGTAAAQAASAQTEALQRANNATRQATQAAREAGAATKSWFGSIGDIAAGNVLANAIGNITGRLSEAGRAFVQANVQVDGLRRAFSAIYKDAGTAEQQIAFLRETSQKSGVSFGALADSFKSFAAATKAANIPIGVTNELFASVTQASATLGLSGERTSLVLQALGQMASKGTVSMEELRQQLGESLPGALSLSAKGLGLTEQQLIKLVESGGLAARDLFPALAESLKELQGENNGLQGSWERLKTAINGVMTAIGDAGGMQVMTAGVKALGVAVGLVLIPLQGFVEVLTGIGRVVGAAGASIAVLLDGSTTWAQKAAALKEVGGALGESFDQAAARMSATQAGFNAVVNGAGRAATSMAGATSAAAGSNAAFAEYSRQWIQIGQTLRDAAAEQEKNAANSAKLADAAKAEGNALVALVALRGNAAATAEAEATAADRSATALGALATARAAQLAAVQQELTAKQALIAGSETEQKARAEEIKQLQDKVAKLQAESTAAAQAAEAARNAATARQAAAEATRDHTGQIQALTDALGRAKTTVAEYERLQLEGKKTAEDVANAKREQALAEARLKDAYSDTTQAVQAGAIAKRADAQAALEQLQTQHKLAGQAIEMARLMGNESQARDLKIKQMELEIQIIQAKANVQRVEAQGSIDVAQAKLAEMQALNTLTPLKKAELDASIKLAQAKLNEADATAKSTDLIKKAIDNVKMYGTEVQKTAESSKRATSDIAGGWQGVSEATQRASKKAEEFRQRMKEKYGRPGDDVADSFDEAAAAAERARKAAERYDNYMASRFERGWAKNEDGSTVVAAVSQAEINQEVARLFGEKNIGNKDAELAAYYKRRLDAAEKNGVHQSARGYFDDLRKEFQRLSEKLIGGGAVAPQRSAQPQQQTGSAGGVSSGASVIRIELGRNRYNVDTTSEDGRQQLEALLRELGTARSRAA